MDRGRIYKRYKCNLKIPVPRRTQRRWRKKAREAILESALEGLSTSGSEAFVNGSDNYGPVFPPAQEDHSNSSKDTSSEGTDPACNQTSDSESPLSSTGGSDTHDDSSTSPLAFDADLSAGGSSTDSDSGEESTASSSDSSISHQRLSNSGGDMEASSDDCYITDSEHYSDASSMDLDGIPGPAMTSDGDSGRDSFETLPSATDTVPSPSALPEENLFGELQENLCDCTNVTQGEAFVAVLSLGLRHSLSYKAMVDILALFNLVYQKDIIPAAYYHLLKHAGPSKAKEHVHPICSHCGVCVDMPASEVNPVVCDCGELVPPAAAAKQFVLTLSMKDQLKDLFETPGIAESLNYRFQREKCADDGLEDIYDGALYKRMSSEGMPLNCKNNFSVAFNTDGVSFGKSSAKQLWPIYITINELPPKLRSRHMLLVGMWVGKGEANMLATLHPFVKECNDLAEFGVDWKRNGVMTNSKIIPLFSVVDTQARWRMLNHKCFSGYYGCTFCEHPGELTVSGLRYGMRSTVPADRTDSSLRVSMMKGYDRRHLPDKLRHYKGSRGPCALMNLAYFNLADGFVPDSMHLLKGVVEQNISLILKKLDDDDVYQISERMLDLCPPSQLTRLPRSLKEFEKFKANELRSFLVIYGVVVMHGVVESKFVSHFCLLSAAMYLLMQKSISRAQLEYAGQLLVLYVTLYEKYYGLTRMTYNVHMLLHVVKGVVNLGPIHTHTCYPFEGKNRYLLQLAKSPLQVAKGVAKRYALYNNLPQLCEKYNVSDDILNYCNNMFFRPLRKAVRANDAVLLGGGSSYSLNPEEEAALTDQFGIIGVRNALQFQRVILGGIRYTTHSYNANSRRDDSAMYHNRHPSNNWCRLTNIVKLETGCVVLFAREMVQSQDTPWRVQTFQLRHIRQIRCEGKLVALSPSEVDGQGMFMTTAQGCFAVRIPFGCRGD